MSRKKKKLPTLKGVEITDIAAEGRALARVHIDGSDNRFVVFVPYGAPGDIADIKLDRKRKSYAEGHIERMIKPSSERIEPKCRHFQVCGGCKWQHLPYRLQLEFKRTQVKDALERIAKVQLPEIRQTLGSEKIYGYRNKMEYTFSEKRWRTWDEINSGKEFEGPCEALGFHIPGAFDKVLHIEECHLQADLGNQIRNYVFNYAVDHSLSFYNIKENAGLLRTLMIRIASTGEVMVVVVLGDRFGQEAEGLLNAVAENFPEITSLLYVVNLKANDTITDQKVEVFKGREYIEEEMEGLKFRINAKSFYQTNSRQAYELYKTARMFAGLEKSETEQKPLVYDLYTGTGTIANFVARNASKVIGIEYVPEAIEDAKINSEANGITNTEFYAGDMKDVLSDEFIAKHGRPDIMIIDPPRAGMHEDVVKVILNAKPETIVYVSCNPATQARDLALLDCMYSVMAVQPVDMFPHTHHVENVVRLERRDLRTFHRKDSVGN